MQIGKFDGITQKQVIIDATAEEIAEIEKMRREEELRLEISKANEIIKEEAKTALLAKLGITEDEARLLLS